MVRARAAADAKPTQIAAEKELAAAGKARLRHLDRADEAIVRELIERHLRFTGSTLALRCSTTGKRRAAKFVKVFPNEYRRALDRDARAQGAASRDSEAAANA